MVEITSDLIKTIREKTGAGMMDCKKALVETNGNFDEAVDWLRKKGLAAAARKASRVAADGLVCIFSDQKTATILEINSETDFVAKNAKFQEFVLKIGEFASKKYCSTLDEFLQQKLDGETVQERIANLIATIGENITIRRIQNVSAEQGVVATYIHSAVAPNLGKIGVLVRLESSGDKEKLFEFGKKLAMHIAASNPLFLNIPSVPSDILNHEKSVLLEQIQIQEKKPQEIINRMVDGRIKKFYEETVFLEQVYVLDGKKKVAEIISDFAKELGSPVNVNLFVKFVLGEGILKQAE
ncbi:MAG: translation elongation factor Ts [Holosporales bacterium]|jgi:elongation factor Ts|nr:translation elongation factor Ts [Holosporales bacterium]